MALSVRTALLVPFPALISSCVSSFLLFISLLSFPSSSLLSNLPLLLFLCFCLSSSSLFCACCALYSDPGSPKKCRARFGLNQQTDWCGPCRCVTNIHPDPHLSTSLLLSSLLPFNHQCIASTFLKGGAALEVVIIF